MNRFSIPAFIEEVSPDTANAKYSRAKLKIYYVGETVDKRLFTEEFSNKLLSTIAYTPVVGFYSVADEDFVGHNNVQHIYGLVPSDTQLQYVEDVESGVKFAVTDIILYTGRPDETGAIANKIVGKQHSLELDPKSVQYKINRDEFGNFKNIEYLDGELIGLSVLGDNDTPAFTGSEFFSAIELPDFITEENINKYQNLFSTISNIEPTAEEALHEIYRAMRINGIDGYVCEHKQDQYAIIEHDYKGWKRYILERTPDGHLNITLDCDVRRRYISDAEIMALNNIREGVVDNIEISTAQNAPIDGEQTTEIINTSASANSENNEQSSFTVEEFEDLRSRYERLENANAELTTAFKSLQSTTEDAARAFEELAQEYRTNIVHAYTLVLGEDVVNKYTSEEFTIEQILQNFTTEYENSMVPEQEPEIFEISNINNPQDSYNDKDPVAVINKYKNI